MLFQLVYLIEFGLSKCLVPSGANVDEAVDGWRLLLERGEPRARAFETFVSLAAMSRISLLTLTAASMESQVNDFYQGPASFAADITDIADMPAGKHDGSVTGSRLSIETHSPFQRAKPHFLTVYRYTIRHMPSNVIDSWPQINRSQ
jgi:hypothetical protein